MVENHSGDVDCNKCKAVFKKEQDVFDHANDCTEILQLNSCDHCKREAISKLALKKHMKVCKQKKLNILCRNGQSCPYFKANRCSFSHPEAHNVHSQQIQNQNQEWHTVQRKSKKVLWTCRFCKAKIHSHEAGRNHICEMHPGKSVDEQLREKRINGQMNTFPQKGQSAVLQSGRPKLWCRFQERCTKGPHCEFRHFQLGFHQTNHQQNQA